MTVRPLAELEREAVEQAMAFYGPNRKAEAAKKLGISLKTLYVRLRKYGLTQYLRDGGRT
jgi:DNA-binding NtrC family response regulator